MISIWNKNGLERRKCRSFGGVAPGLIVLFKIISICIPHLPSIFSRFLSSFEPIRFRLVGTPRLGDSVYSPLERWGLIVLLRESFGVGFWGGARRVVVGGGNERARRNCTWVRWWLREGSHASKGPSRWNTGRGEGGDGQQGDCDGEIEETLICTRDDTCEIETIYHVCMLRPFLRTPALSFCPFCSSGCLSNRVLRGRALVVGRCTAIP